MDAPIALFRRTRIILDSDCDALGHVNNVVWVRFIVELAEAHSEANGLGLAATLSHGGVWVVQHHDIHYRRDARPGDTVEECTWVSRLRGARSVRHARFVSAGGERLVESTTDWAFVDPVSGRPRRIPAPVQERFRTLEAPEVG